MFRLFSICFISFVLTFTATKAAPFTTEQSPSPSLSKCSGPNRAERKLTCIVDGDTGWQNGVKWRLLSIDTPEISRPGCQAEKVRGDAATRRLIELMKRGYILNWAGETGNLDRQLVSITLHNGQDAGRVLLSEHLAQVWPNEGNIWCE